MQKVGNYFELIAQQIIDTGEENLLDYNYETIMYQDQILSVLALSSII